VSMRRSKRLVALVAGLALVAAACGGDDDDDTADTGAPTTEEAASDPTTADTAATDTTTADTAGSDTTTGDTADEGTTPAGEGGAMTVTLQLNQDAVWDDGTPITIADLQCTFDAFMNTPGSLSTEGYNKITSISDGAADGEVVIDFSEPYAAYKNLFNTIIKADFFTDCKDVSGDLGQELPFSGRPYKIESWSLDQEVLVANEAYWGDAPVTPRVVMVPRDETALLSGEVDFIFPQAFAGLSDTLDGDADLSYTPGYGTNYEGLYFQAYEGPFADSDFRHAFAKSISRDTILASIYEPIFPGGPMLNCGLWVPTIGDWCDDSAFGTPEGTDGFYDPEGAEQILTEAGWEKDGDGFWAKDGVAPTIRWMVNTPNPRREDTQALMIPELQAAGFNVVADNCDAACVFQQRLPSLDFDLAMYINTAQPDPTVTGIMACESIPTPENNNVGQNSTGYCNEEASALMTESDQTLDIPARVELIHQIAGFLAEDAAMLPLYQFPNIAAWNTTKVGGPVDKDAGNYQGFQNIDEWEDVDGDGQILIGNEQWPECLNPITECSNSSWYQWSVGFKVLPALWDTTSEGEYVPSDLLTAEPEVVVG
jgi:peptide/nickel transport system substrate-binding protein